MARTAAQKWRESATSAPLQRPAAPSSHRSRWGSPPEEGTRHDAHVPRPAPRRCPRHRAGLRPGVRRPASADTVNVNVNAYDIDANGYVDAYGFDGSGDGYEDTWAIDWNEDGIVEQVAVDTDLDGYADTWAFDSDEDGYVEQVGVDTNGDAYPDVWGVDENLDGYTDTLYYDVDFDGYADYYETAASDAYAYASVSYVFVEADGWVYWEATADYGYGYSSLDNSGSGVQTAADQPERAGAASPESTGVMEEIVQALLG